ncbi:hypothetical protein [Weissella soli]
MQLLSYSREDLREKNRLVNRKAGIGGFFLGIAIAIFTGQMFGGDD